MANSNDTGPSHGLTVPAAANLMEDVLFPRTPDKEASATPGSDTDPVEKDDSESLLSDKSNSDEPVSDDTEVEGEGDPDHDDQPDNEGDEAGDLDDVDEQPETKPQTFRVKVRGEEVEVTQDELLNGYSRQADYTRSKQELAEAKKKFEAEEVPAVRERAIRYAEGLTQIEAALKELMPAEPDWEKLMVEAPETLATEKAKWDVYKDRLARIEQNRAAVAQQIEADRIEERKKVVRAENEKLLEMVPEWKDTKVASKEKAELVTYAKSLGFTDDDLAQVVNANAMVLLRNAYLYTKAQKKVPAIRKTIETVKNATPGPRDNSRPAEKDQVKRRQRLVKTGRVADAADVLLHSDLLDNV